MTEVAVRCAHCAAPIVDPTTQVVHGEHTYCCANCSGAMEQVTGGSDPQGVQREGDIRCARCTSPIVDDRSIEMRGDQMYCCRNCASAAQDT